MIEISKRMIKQWCKVNGEPGYLLTTGAKVAQSAVKFVEMECPSCKQTALKLDDAKRDEAYIRRFGKCLSCHAKELFPNDEDKQGSFIVTMGCKKTVSFWGAEYRIDPMLQTCERQK